MTAMIDDPCAGTRGNGSRPTAPIGDGALGQIREILAGPRLGQAGLPAVPTLAAASDGLGAHPVWIMVALLLEAIARETRSDPGADAALTHGEIRVLRYLPTNLSTKEIAGELYLSVNTIKTHQRHLYQKLGARSRSQAVDQARALGLLAPSSRSH
jgi:DNA-binding CsgD family transcriptional regulator